MLLWPAGSEEEGFPPTTVYPVPEIVAWEILTVAVPVFVTVTLCVALLPIATFPKLRLAALGESTPALESPGVPGLPVCEDAALVYPAQLDRPTMASIIAIVTRIASGSRFAILRLSEKERRRDRKSEKFCARMFMARTV